MFYNGQKTTEKNSLPSFLGIIIFMSNFLLLSTGLIDSFVQLDRMSRLWSFRIEATTLSQPNNILQQTKICWKKVVYIKDTWI